MAELFDIAELVKVAIEDEKSGAAFYSRLAEKAGEFQEVFADLAEEERAHQKHFEDILAGLGGHKPPEQHSGQYATYLRTLTGSRAFPDDQAAAAAAEQCADDQAALDLADRFERDTLILMNEMRQMTSGKHPEIIDELIAEEQRHLVTLAEARRKLA